MKISAFTGIRLATIFLIATLPSAIFAVNIDRLGQEDDIREAVFRHQFDHNASGQQKTAHAYWLAIFVSEKDSDPSAQFMKRFAHHTRRFSTGRLAIGPQYRSLIALLEQP
jgi:hypothetical protein